MLMKASAIAMREEDSLFAPFLSRKLQLKTRLVMSSIPRLLSQGGVPTPEMLLYYRRRAEHMLGLIITEPVAINDPSASADSGMACFYGGSALRAWKRICRAVHHVSCRLIPSLSHVGMLRPAVGDFPNPDSLPVGPSGVEPVSLERRGEPLSITRIQSIISAFASAALDSKLLGFDGVEIDGAHAGLVEQFLRPETNLRTDEFGGDISRRARFAWMILHAVRKAVGRKYPVIFRFSHQGRWHKPLVNTPADLEILLQMLVDAGADMFSCDGIGEPAFRGSPLNLPGWVRLLTRRPVIASGGVGLKGMEMKPLMQRYRAKEFDLVGVGRALLADAAWGTKIRLSREDEIIPYSAASWLHLY